MLVKIGRGVGSGLLSGGQPMLGSRFAAGEIGHVTVGTDGGPQCACGKVRMPRGLASSVPSPRRIADAADAGPRRHPRAMRGSGWESRSPRSWARSTCRRSSCPAPLNFSTARSRQATVETLRIADARRSSTTACEVRMTEQGQDIVLRGAAVMVLSGQLGVS